MQNIPEFLQAVQILSPEQMLFVVAFTAIIVVGGIAYVALKGGRHGDA